MIDACVFDSRAVHSLTDRAPQHDAQVYIPAPLLDLLLVVACVADEAVAADVDDGSVLEEVDLERQAAVESLGRAADALLLGMQPANLLLLLAKKRMTEAMELPMVSGMGPTKRLALTKMAS